MPPADYHPPLDKLLTRGSPENDESKGWSDYVQELGLGLALDMETLTSESLHAAVTQVAHEPTVRTNLHEMQREIHKSGGSQRAADAIMVYTRKRMHA